MSLNSYGANTLNRPNSKNSTLNERRHEMEINQKACHQSKPMPPRPRSADFLEYESKKQMRKLASLRGGAVDPFSNRMPTRPKSSLDINSSVDSYYYSEASYAAKMRQSAQYLQGRNVMRPQSVLKDEFNRNTLRYENERKRLTSEFQSYTAAAAAAGKSASINANSLPSDFQRGGSDLRLTDEWKLSPLKRKGVYSADEQSITFRDDTSPSQSFLNSKLLRSECKKFEICTIHGNYKLYLSNIYFFQAVVSSSPAHERHFVDESLQSLGVSSKLAKATSSNSNALDRRDIGNSIWVWIKFI